VARGGRTRSCNKHGFAKGQEGEALVETVRKRDGDAVRHMVQRETKKKDKGEMNGHTLAERGEKASKTTYARSSRMTLRMERPLALLFA